MSVTRHWRRSALGASGVALLLPLGLTVGVAFTAALGGQDTLRALGQVFEGPAAPPSRAPGLETARKVPPVPVRAPRDRTSPAVATAGQVVAPAGAPSVPAPDTGRPGREPSPDRPDPAPPAPSAPEPVAPAPAPSPEVAPEPAPSALNEAGQAVADGVAAQPAPVGPAGGDAMESVVELIP